MNSNTLSPGSPESAGIAGTENDIVVKETVAARLHKTPRTIEIWTRQKKLPSILIGRSRLYSWKQILAHLNENYSVNGK